MAVLFLVHVVVVVDVFGNIIQSNILGNGRHRREEEHRKLMLYNNGFSVYRVSCAGYLWDELPCQRAEHSERSSVVECADASMGAPGAGKSRRLGPASPARTANWALVGRGGCQDEDDEDFCADGTTEGAELGRAASFLRPPRPALEAASKKQDAAND